MYKHDLSHGKAHTHTSVRFFALMLCLCLIISTFSGLLPKVVLALDGNALGLNTKSEDDRPSAQTYGEGVLYLDEFLEQHPDAKVYGRDKIMPLAVGTPGERIDPAWFKATILKIGGIKRYGTFTLDAEDGTFWSLESADGLQGEVFIISPDDDYADEASWPISGQMIWHEFGYVKDGNYPKLSSSAASNNIDYGITSAYLGDTRVYNVGVVGVGAEKHLWISINENGDDNDVIVLPDTTPHNEITLNYGPIEYPVSFRVMVKDLDGTTYPLESTPDNVLMALWGTTDIDDIKFQIFDTNALPNMTSGKTARFDVNTPYGTYSDVTYTCGSKSGTVYPALDGYGNNRLGAEPDYAMVIDEEEGDKYLEETTAYGGPDRYSLSERYILGKDGGINDSSLVTVTVVRRHGAYDENSNPNGYKFNYTQLETLLGTTDNRTTRGRIVTGKTNYIYYQYTSNGYADVVDNGDGTFNASLMFTIYDINTDRQDYRINTLEINGQELVLPDTSGAAADRNNNSWRESEEFVLDDGSKVKVYYCLLHDLAVNYVQDADFNKYFNSGIYAESTSEQTYNADGEPDGIIHMNASGDRTSNRTTTQLKDENGNDTRPYPKMGTINEPNYNGFYYITIKGAKRDINFTVAEEGASAAEKGSKSRGKLVLNEAVGVDVQVWSLGTISSLSPAQTNRHWEPFYEGSKISIYWHNRNQKYQHGWFRFFDGFLSPRNLTNEDRRANAAYQKYNIRLKLQEGYGWKYTDRTGQYDYNTGDEILTISNGVGAIKSTFEHKTYYYSPTPRTLVERKDDIELVKYSSSLVTDAETSFNDAVNVSGTNPNADRKGTANTNSKKSVDPDPTTVYSTSDNCYIIFNGNGSYSAYLKRPNNNTYTTFTGKYKYENGILSIIPNNSNGTPASVQLPADGTSVQLSLEDRYNNSTNTSDTYKRTGTFTMSVNDLPDTNLLKDWYYASLDELPEFNLRTGRTGNLNFVAQLQKYDVKYIDGLGADGKTPTGPNGQYTSTSAYQAFNLDKSTMPYYKNNYLDEGIYSKGDGYTHFMKVSGAQPKDAGTNRSSFLFKYWVLTDVEGNPVDEHGEKIERKAGESIADWQLRFITFYPGDSVMLSALDDYAMNEEHGAGFDSAEQTFTVYLTACWSAEPQTTYISFLTANTRAGFGTKGNLVGYNQGSFVGDTQFEGIVYDQTTGEEDENASNKIKSVFVEESIINLEQAGAIYHNGKLVVGPTVTVDKDYLIDYLGKLDEKYKWLTYDDEMNGWELTDPDWYKDGVGGTRQHEITGNDRWEDIYNMGEVPVWFRYSLGGVTFNNEIDGYDQPVPYKLTLTLPTYEGEDRKLNFLDEDHTEWEWDETDYRYTYGNESEYFMDDPDADDITYSVSVNLTTGSAHDKDGYERAGFVASKDDIDVAKYLSNADVLKDVQKNSSSTSAKLILQKDKDDSNTYYAIIYLGHGDIINIPELPEKTTYGLEIQDLGYREEYDGYEMQKAEPNKAKTETLWKSTDTSITKDSTLMPVLDTDHNESKNYFDIAMTKTGDGKKQIGFKSTDYALKDGSGDVTDTYKGINAYDTQYIDVTTKGTYTLYLDQATIEQTKVDPGEDVDEEELTISDQLEVQNFDYLSYKNTARNLTNSPQTLEITFDIATHRIGNSDLYKRYLSVVRINSSDVNINQEGVPEEDKEGKTETSGETDIEFADGTTGTAIWTYYYDSHQFVYKVTDVPAGERIDLTVRTTVPAVNTVTSYTGNSVLVPTTDDEYKDKSFTDSEVQAVVFSNWLRIAAFIGPDTSNLADVSAYKLTQKDQQEVFKYKVTLDDGEDNAVNAEIHYMVFNNSDAYGTEHEESEQQTVSIEDGTLTANDDGTYSFYVELMHDQRVVIYDMFREGIDDQSDESDDPSGAAEEEQPETSEPINGVKYTVVWEPEKKGTNGREEDQNKDYFAYSYGINGYKADGTENRTANRTDWKYSGEITEGIDMVVYRYMSSDDLEITKDVTGPSADTSKGFVFTVTLTVPDGIEELLEKYTLMYRDSDGSETEQDVTLNPIDNEDPNAPKSYTITVTLKHGQTAIIEGLPAGTYYTVTETDYSSEGYVTSAKVPDKTDNKSTWGNGEPSADGRSISGYILTDFVDPDDASAPDVFVDNKVLFTNNKTINNVSISKKVVSENTELLGTSFTFTVTVYAPKGYNPAKHTFGEGSEAKELPAFAYTGGIISGFTGVTNAESGYIAWNEEKNAYIGTVTLKHGQQITFENLPYGTIVVAQETENSAFETEINDNYDAATDGRVAVMLDKLNFVSGYSIEFTNTEIILDGDLILYKIVPDYVKGYDLEKFTFTVYLTDVSGAAVTDNIDGLEKTETDGYYTVAVENLKSVRTGGGALDLVKNLKTGTYGNYVEITLPYGTNYVITENGTDAADWKYEVPNWNWTLPDTTDPTDTHTGTISGDDSIAVCTNTKTGTLILDKVVGGSTGNRNEDFTFTITLQDADGNSLNERFAATHTGNGDITELEFNVDGEATVKLKHGQSITIKGLPYGASYSIKETTTDWYESTITTNDSDARSNNSTRTITGNVEAQEVTVESTDQESGSVTKTKAWVGSTTVTYKNTRDGNIPTNATLVTLWPIPLFILAIFGMIAILVIRRRGKAAN